MARGRAARGPARRGLLAGRRRDAVLLPLRPLLRAPPGLAGGAVRAEGGTVAVLAGRGVLRPPAALPAGSAALLPADRAAAADGRSGPPVERRLHALPLLAGGTACVPPAARPRRGFRRGALRRRRVDAFGAHDPERDLADRRRRDGIPAGHPARHRAHRAGPAARGNPDRGRRRGPRDPGGASPCAARGGAAPGRGRRGRRADVRAPGARRRGPRARGRARAPDRCAVARSLPADLSRDLAGRRARARAAGPAGAAAGPRPGPGVSAGRRDARLAGAGRLCGRARAAALRGRARAPLPAGSRLPARALRVASRRRRDRPRLRVRGARTVRPGRVAPADVLVPRSGAVPAVLVARGRRGLGPRALVSPRADEEGGVAGRGVPRAARRRSGGSRAPRRADRAVRSLEHRAEGGGRAAAAPRHRRRGVSAPVPLGCGPALPGLLPRKRPARDAPRFRVAALGQRHALGPRVRVGRRADAPAHDRSLPRAGPARGRARRRRRGAGQRPAPGAILCRRGAGPRDRKRRGPAARDPGSRGRGRRSGRRRAPDAVPAHRSAADRGARGGDGPPARSVLVGRRGFGAIGPALSGPRGARCHPSGAGSPGSLRQLGSGVGRARGRRLHAGPARGRGLSRRAAGGRNRIASSSRTRRPGCAKASGWAWRASSASCSRPCGCAPKPAKRRALRRRASDILRRTFA